MCALEGVILKQCHLCGFTNSQHELQYVTGLPTDLYWEYPCVMDLEKISMDGKI